MIVDLETETIRSSSNLEDWKFFICFLFVAESEKKHNKHKNRKISFCSKSSKRSLRTVGSSAKVIFH